MTTQKNYRPERGWPALFHNWDIGDSMPVVGDVNYVLETAQRYFDSQRVKAVGCKFTLSPISSTLTRVTRVQ